MTDFFIFIWDDVGLFHPSLVHYPIALLVAGLVCDLLGRFWLEGAQREVLAAIRENDDGSIPHGVRATIACEAGEPEEALIELERALRSRDPVVVTIGTWPMFDCVRSAPRFQDLLRKINWPGLEE